VSRAGGNCTRGSEDGDAGADWQAQQGAATDARSVGEDIAEFNSAAGREVLASFEEESQNERGLPVASESSVFPNRDQGCAKSVHVILRGCGTLGAGWAGGEVRCSSSGANSDSSAIMPR
jgi:hypothetical protein